MDFLNRTVNLYLAATISPDVGFHKFGCVELLSLVSFIQVPWDSILFKSIPVKNEYNYYTLVLTTFTNTRGNSDNLFLLAGM